MRRLIYPILCLLCLSSCQQKYWQVRKVKVDKQEMVQKEDPKEPKEETEPETMAEVLTDTLSEFVLNPTEVATEETKANAETIDTKPGFLTAIMEGTIQQFPQYIFKSLVPDELSEETDDLPLTSREKLLILCVFYIWLVPLVFLSMLPIAFVYFAVFIGLITGILFISAGALVAFIVLTAILLVLSLIFSFKFGKNQINRKLDRELNRQDLLPFFLLALAVLLFIVAVTGLFLIFEIAPEVLTIIRLLVFIFALVYVISWK